LAPSTTGDKAEANFRLSETGVRLDCEAHV
jgi:hypothetical protein